MFYVYYAWHENKYIGILNIIRNFIFAVAQFLICLKMVLRAICYGYSKD